MSPHQTVPRNPFATCRTRPGRLPYLFGDDLTVSELARRLKRQHWKGQIVGPHGSGKTTLLESLLPVCATDLGRIRHITLTRGQRKLPLTSQHLKAFPEMLLVIDGYEQLSRVSRLWLNWQVRRYRLGLLVTTHVPVMLPVLYRTVTTPRLTQTVVRQLASAEDSDITDVDIRRAHDRHSGNLREVLFELYDLFHQRSRGQLK